MILVYFKNPAISLVMAGDLNEKVIESLDNNKLGPIIVMDDPDGKTQILFPRSDLDITYMKEITEEDWQKMKDEQEEMKRERLARGGGRFNPGPMFPGRGAGKGRGN